MKVCVAQGTSYVCFSFQPVLHLWMYIQLYPPWPPERGSWCIWGWWHSLATPALGIPLIPFQVELLSLIVTLITLAFEKSFIQSKSLPWIPPIVFLVVSCVAPCLMISLALGKQSQPIHLYPVLYLLFLSRSKLGLYHMIVPAISELPLI